MTASAHIWLLLRGQDHLQMTSAPINELDAKAWADSLNRSPTLQRLELKAVVRLPAQGELFSQPKEANERG